MSSTPMSQDEGAQTPDFAPEPEPATGADEANGDRESITGVHGTVAHFEMSYSPPGGSRTKFGPPLTERIPSALYLAGALAMAAVVSYAYGFAPPTSRIFGWVVEGDRNRPISADVLTVVVVVSALATVLRTHMKGVLVSDDWIEARYLLAFGIPRARRWGWPQVLRLIVDDASVAFEFWDGTYERLPRVARSNELVNLLRQHANRHRIDITVLHRLEPASPATRS
ncbi:MAG: hypothetical protein ACRENE_07600 [Polyangiaceae bacterium]